ncbi:hypothetical protein [Hazenella coriacea]|uniref:Uncharacterized protein n=1 Tax=Hazenella coriacea TaxID=1179467 RepID=A0A4R3L0U6_9BACL|nr:hypothetical protein [Hazenella coriacea]TCS92211.1 hypothetical protein EDD58_1142 [Hazenella coriacea]
MNKKIELSSQFIRKRNLLFSKKERDLIRLGIVKMMDEWTEKEYPESKIQELQRLFWKFDDGKSFDHLKGD